MNLQVTGKLVSIGDTQQVTDKFKKREFVIEMIESINGNDYTNYGKFQTVQTKCDVLDRYRIGDNVCVSFNIKGTSYTDKKDGQTKYITNLDAWKVETAQATAQQPQSAVGNYAGGHAGAGPAYQPPVYQPPVQNYAAAVDDLPF